MPVELSINQDTVNAYERRHQRFLQALRGEPVPKENGSITSQEEAEDDTATKVGGRRSDSQTRRQKSIVKQARSLPGRLQTQGLAEEDKIELPEHSKDKQYRRPAWVHKLGTGFKRLDEAPWMIKAGREAQQANESRSVSFTPNTALPKPTHSISKGRGDGAVHHSGALQEPAFPKDKEREKIPSSPKLTLFEELFPDEVEHPATNTPSPSRIEVPKLTIPELEEDDARFEDQYVAERKKGDEMSKSASTDAYKNWNLAILVLQIASPSLTDDDFRRIAPQGQHIRGWVGPGDIFKVIPARDPTTLQQQTHYFLVFPNPAYARTYQHHVRRLHLLAQMHTPTSIDSPITIPKGMMVQGEDMHDLLQSYTLLPPSQRLHLRALFPPHSEGVKRLLERRGYPELMVPKDKTGRCVLFWVEGFVPTIEQVRQLLYRDGRARGLVWALLDGKESVQQLEPDANLESEDGSDMEMQPPSENGEQHGEQHGEQQGFGDYLRRSLRRWTIAFKDEDEARRFVRRWHLRPFSSAFTERAHPGDIKPLVHAEFMW